MSSFYAIKRLLARWPDLDGAAAPMDDSIFDRLRRALLGFGSGRTGPGDLAGLIRQILARQALHVDNTEAPKLMVPRAAGWPSRVEWTAFGVEVRAEEPSRFQLCSRAWRPAWLDSGTASPIDDILRETHRRHDASVPADPAFSELLDPAGRRYRTYSSPGQRDAVRAAFLLPPGATLLVTLPTGAGKSLVFQAPAMAARLDGALTVIIVPTVALARDLERRFRPLFDEREAQLAYHGGLAPELKRAMRARIRAGEQTLVITSPESALGALRAALFDAARAGRLRYLVVDEAHLIAQWGTEFRPEFQLLAGLREGLLTTSPPDRKVRTILATATLTAETWWTLSTLFGAMEVIAAVHLRPEPSHWLDAAADEDDRREKVLEAVRHVPRPFILYTSIPDDATQWLAALRNLGMRRTEVVRGGDMSGEAGASILERWASRELDAIVATSAFGLGVDQADVRTVIHACVPETVDRYYQEVGRAGRDGKAALSLVVHTPADLRDAQNLAKERVIGVEKGLARWTAMYQARESVPGSDDVFFVPLTTQPAYMRRDSGANLAWNRRTLLLMARMGLIRLDAKPPPRSEPYEGECEEAFEERCRLELDRFFEMCAVRIVRGDHLSRSVWNQNRSVAKEASSSDDAKQMEALLSCHEPLAKIFARTYTVREIGVVPEIAGGGCPASRRNDDELHGYVTPFASPLQHVVDTFDRSRPSALPWYGFQLVSYVPPDDAATEERWHRMIFELLGRLVARGIVEVAVDALLAGRADVRGLWRKSPLRFVIQRRLDEEDRPTGESPTPRVSVVGSASATKNHDHLLCVDRPFHLMVVPISFHEVGVRRRPLIELRPHLPLGALLSRLDR